MASQESRRPVISMSDDGGAITSEDVAPRSLPASFIESDIARAVAGFRLPAYRDLPTIELYRDQVIGFVEGVMEPLDSLTGTSSLTPAMVNNYVKSGVIPAPVRKRYGREHVAKLLAVCVFKQLLPLSAIQRLMRMQALSYTVEQAYDFVAREMARAMDEAFTGVAAAPDASQERYAAVQMRETLLVRSAARAFASWAFMMAYLRYSGYEG